MRPTTFFLALSCSLATATLAHAGLACSCPGDFAANGLIDGADLGVLLANWGQPSTDLTGDGTTDGADLGIMLAAWGPCGGPANDLCGNAQTFSVGAAPVSIDFCNEGANTDGPQPVAGSCDAVVSLFMADVWFQFVAEGDGTMVLSTCDAANFDTIIAVYKPILPQVGACPPSNGGPGLVSLVACDDDTDGCSNNTSRVEFDVVAGFVYKVRIGGFAGATGTGTLTATFESVGNNCFEPIDLGDDADVIAPGTTVDNDLGVEAPCGFNDTASEWFVWTAPCTAGIVMKTCDPDTDFDTVLSVYRYTFDGGCTGMLVECDDDTETPACDLPGIGSKSRVSFFSDAGTQYYIQVTGYNGAKGNFVLSIAQDCP